MNIHDLTSSVAGTLICHLLLVSAPQSFPLTEIYVLTTALLSQIVDTTDVMAVAALELLFF